MDQEKTAAAFNEWMRRYVETPEQFAREWQTVTKFQAEQSKGKKLSYGVICAEYFARLLNEEKK